MAGLRSPPRDLRPRSTISPVVSLAIASHRVYYIIMHVESRLCSLFSAALDAMSVLGSTGCSFACCGDVVASSLVYL